MAIAAVTSLDDPDKEKGKFSRGIARYLASTFREGGTTRKKKVGVNL